MLNVGGQIDGIAVVLFVAFIIFAVKTAVHSFPGLRTCDVPVRGSESDGSVVLELSGDTDKRGIYYVSNGTSVGRFSDMMDLSTDAVFADECRDRVLSGGDRLKVFHDASGGTVISCRKMRSSTALALDQPIDLNGATIGELMLIPGVGEKTAEAIVELRKKRGRFLRVDEIRAVSGLGKRMYERIERHFYVACN